MTLLSVKNPDDALDIVQDAMLKLARNYASKDPEAWPALFYRVLKNRTTDFHRKQIIHKKLFGWLPKSDEQDPLETAIAPNAKNPDQTAVLTDFGPSLMRALETLPERQRQAFVLRTWEELDVKQTAVAMSITQGSVKTHYSRAVRSLREQLTEFDNELE